MMVAQSLSSPLSPSLARRMNLAPLVPPVADWSMPASNSCGDLPDKIQGSGRLVSGAAMAYSEVAATAFAAGTVARIHASLTVTCASAHEAADKDISKTIQCFFMVLPFVYGQCEECAAPRRRGRRL